MISRYSLPEISEIWEEKYKLTKWLEIEVLACEAQTELGIIPKSAMKTIKEKANFDINRMQDIEKEIRHDVIAFLTTVSEYVGEDSRYIHLGMTSSDMLDTALALQMRDAGKLILEKMHELHTAIKERALEHKTTIMMGRSHGIHAEPITFGLKLAVWYSEMERNIQRMEKAVENVSYGKISGAVGTFAHMKPFVEEYVCEKLGLKPAPISTQIVQRDRHAEYLTTIAVIGSSLDKFATEIRNLQRTDIHEVEEFFGKKQKGSSAMPHKRNPIVSERISGMSRLLRGNALAAMENVALWHERDISHSSVERVVLPDSTITLYYMLVKMTNLVKNLLVYPETMEYNIHKMRGLIYSQAILLELAKKGITREDAYRWVQRNAMNVWQDEDSTLQHLILQDEDIRKVLSETEINGCFDMQRHLDNVDFIFRRVGLI